MSTARTIRPRRSGHGILIGRTGEVGAHAHQIGPSHSSGDAIPGAGVELPRAPAPSPATTSRVLSLIVPAALSLLDLARWQVTAARFEPPSRRSRRRAKIVGMGDGGGRHGDWCTSRNGGWSSCRGRASRSGERPGLTPIRCRRSRGGDGLQRRRLPLVAHLSATSLRRFGGDLIIGVSDPCYWRPVQARSFRLRTTGG